MEKSVAKVRFEGLDNGDGESSASEAELSGREDAWSEDEEGSGDETRRMIAQQNRKGKNLEDFNQWVYIGLMASLACALKQFSNTFATFIARSESSCVHWNNAEGVQSPDSYSEEGGY